MGILTLEATIDRGQIRLRDNVMLPERTKVYVIVPSIQVAQTSRVVSPHLAHPEQATDFRMEIVEEPADASL